MKTSTASGLQIAFFTFAVLLLAVPLSGWLSGLHPWSAEVARLIEKATPFLMAGAILLAFPGSRRQCRAELGQPIPPERQAETLFVGAAHLVTAFGWAGAAALGYWIAGGEQRLAYAITRMPSHDEEMRRAFLGAEMVRSLLVAGVLAPLIEELVFRGLLYRAWEKQWGWVPSMLLTSTLFGLYHPNFAPSFVSSILYVCLLRRTGSLWAPIVAHAMFNILGWYPLTAQFVFPRDLLAPGDLSSWPLQLACLLITLVAVPAYVWMARRKREPAEEFPPTVVNGAFSQ